MYNISRDIFVHKILGTVVICELIRHFESKIYNYLSVIQLQLFQQKYYVKFLITIMINWLKNGSMK